MSTLALKLVEKCLETKDPYLDLGRCGLRGQHFVDGSPLDKVLKHCGHVKTLILSSEWWNSDEKERGKSQNIGPRNFFNGFPSSILSLNKLEVLICAGSSDSKWGISSMLFVAQFSDLTTLNLSCNKIKEISGLENLSHLLHLNIFNNQIQEIKGLESLSNLRDLDFSSNQIREIKGLENLSTLERFDIRSNRIQEIKGLENLTRLQTLNFNNNQIQEIKGLERLTGLQVLEIGGNEIQEIKGLECLTALRELEIGGNQIQEVKGLERLMALRILEISYNQISNLKHLVPFLRNKKSAGDSKIFGIRLTGNPLEVPPLEIAKQGSEAILNYFEQLEKQGTEYLYEAKMLIVGQPRAGKTSLRYKLFDNTVDLPKEDETTRGIDIKRLEFDITDKDGKSRQFYYNVWDFGGQHIYQTTHQFFLTHRSLYVLLIDTGKDSIGNDDTTLNYWLQAVELLGGNSPLLLVKNEKNERQVNIDLPQKRARFEFLKGEYSVDLNALIPGSSNFSDKRATDFAILKEDIETELKRLPLVGFPMPKNWVDIRNELQTLSTSKHYIHKQTYLDICERYSVTEYERQMELSRIFHDLGIFLHFQKYRTLEDYIILQNTWATDAVFAVFDDATVQANKGRFTDDELCLIWKDKGYEPIVHNLLLALMMQFELCYQVDQKMPHSYIIPEMLSDKAPAAYVWVSDKDLPLQYRYDFMPKGILTRLIVRMNKHIALNNDQQIAWKTGVKINGNSLGSRNTFAEVTEAWDNKQLNIRIQGPFAKDLMSKLTFQVDELNNEFFRQNLEKDQPQKSKWYKMIPCNCESCNDNVAKHFYDYDEMLEMKEFGIPTIRCRKKPFIEVNITGLIDGVIDKEIYEKQTVERPAHFGRQTIKIFLASSSELENERSEFEKFIRRENDRLNDKGVYLKLEIWEDFLDAMSQTRLQDEYNKAISGCDIFVMLYFTKVGKYTAEEFANAFKQFKETDKPKVYTYFKKAVVLNTDEDREATKSLWAFQDKLKELGHFPTIFKNDEDLHLHFKKQLERLYDL